MSPKISATLTLFLSIVCGSVLPAWTSQEAAQNPGSGRDVDLSSKQWGFVLFQVNIAQSDILRLPEQFSDFSSAIPFASCSSGNSISTYFGNKRERQWKEHQDETLDA